MRQTGHVLGTQQKLTLITIQEVITIHYQLKEIDQREM